MNHTGRFGLTLAAILAAGAGGYWAGHRDVALPGLSQILAEYGLTRAASQAATAEANQAMPVIYFRDPDGKPAYAAGPRKTSDGRDFLPVLAGEDTSFDATPPPGPAEAGAPAKSAEKRLGPRGRSCYEDRGSGFPSRPGA